MNKIRLISDKGIEESFSNISNTHSVEIEFDLKNMDVADTQTIRKYLNQAYNDNKIWYRDWEIISSYTSGVLLKGVDSFKNGKYIEIMKVGDQT